MGIRAAGRASTLRVLLVEPAWMDRLVLRTLLQLRAEGRFRLTETADLELALALLRQRRHDLVLVNENLPDGHPRLREFEDAADGAPVIGHARYLAEPEDGLGELLTQVLQAMDERERGRT